jgi:hypothetical protein
MDTKEAIEFIKLCKLEASGFEGWKFDKVISLLQHLSTSQEQGEKYKACWEELKSKYYNHKLVKSLPKMELYKCLAEVINEYEQKYFPKSDSVKKTITIEVETKSEIAAKHFIDWLHNAIDYTSAFNHDATKVNIKEVI